MQERKPVAWPRRMGMNLPLGILRRPLILSRRERGRWSVCDLSGLGIEETVRELTERYGI